MVPASSRVRVVDEGRGAVVLGAGSTSAAGVVAGQPGELSEPTEPAEPAEVGAADGSPPAEVDAGVRVRKPGTMSSASATA